MVYDTKIVLHIPCMAWDDGPVEIDYRAFEQILMDRLAGVGVTSSYEAVADGCYKGRIYPEILLTIFCEAPYSNDITEIFRQTFTERNDIMQQEAFAYECDGVLFTKELSKV